MFTLEHCTRGLTTSDQPHYQDKVYFGIRVTSSKQRYANQL